MRHGRAGAAAGRSRAGRRGDAGRPAWIDLFALVPALPAAAALYTWCRRGRRPLLALVAAEVIVGSLVLYATLNERLYGGPTPWSAAAAGRTETGAASAGEYAERTGRLAALWLDPGEGLLRRAPGLALVPFAAWLLWRSRRERLARALPARATAEAAAGLALAMGAAQLLVAAFLVPPGSDDEFPARHLMPAVPVAGALVAWGLRHAPRAAAVLGALTLAVSAWVLVAGP